MSNSTQIKNDIESTASSHVFEALNNLSTPITTDMDEAEICELIRAGSDHYEYGGIENNWDALTVVMSGEFPSADYTDLDGCTSSLDALNREANDIANQKYYELVSNEINEVAERIMAIIEKAQELDYDGAFQVSGSSIYGWEAHNYETDCGICIWSDERKSYSYNPSLLEGELWAIEGEVNGLTVGACWVPEVA